MLHLLTLWMLYISLVAVGTRFWVLGPGILSNKLVAGAGKDKESSSNVLGEGMALCELLLPRWLLRCLHLHFCSHALHLGCCS